MGNFMNAYNEAITLRRAHDTEHQKRLALFERHQDDAIKALSMYVGEENVKTNVCFDLNNITLKLVFPVGRQYSKYQLTVPLYPTDHPEDISTSLVLHFASGEGDQDSEFGIYDGTDLVFNDEVVVDDVKLRAFVAYWDNLLPRWDYRG